MKNSEFEKRMRAQQQFHTLRLPPDAWAVLRVDGRSFSRFTETYFEKPFDSRFHHLMVQTAQALLEELHGVYAYTESDEISVLFDPRWNMFDREVEKVISISAAIASATFTLASARIAQFDSRIWVGDSSSQVVDYFRWRQSDAERCALNGWCYWTLRKTGKTPDAAMAEFDRTSPSDKIKLLERYGVNYDDLPAWQRCGAGLYWETFEKVGFDPIQNTVSVGLRRKVTIEETLPVQTDYGVFLRRFLIPATAISD